MNNKIGFVEKEFIPIGNNTNYMDLINQYTRKELSEEDVYIFPIALCNNDIDRDFEMFSVDSLRSLSKLYIGKTGILDHDAKSKNQVARIFKTSVDSVLGKKTKTGDDFYNLNAMAYILKSEKNSDIISEIDGGIKKEVSVGCSIGKSVCSICGKDYYKDVDCSHRKGIDYDGKTCYVILDDPTDAYEFSFVAVPAQPEAGVQKAYDKLRKDKDEKVLEYKEFLKDYNIDEEKFTKIVDNEGKQISAETFKSCVDAYKEMNPIEKIDTSEFTNKIADLENERDSFKEKASNYDKIVNDAISDAIKEGIRAKGDSFDEERWNKILKSFDYKEILGQKEEWHGEAEKQLNAGRRVSEPYGYSATVKSIEDGKYNF